MREIKFRAIIPVNSNEPKTMVYYDCSRIDDLNRMAYEDWDINQLMRFTGLKDKNGKEIYEGDFIYYDLAGGLGLPKQTGLKREVKYSPYGFFGQYDINIIVVGNVYENSELLNQ
jgi:hypothetical protein